MFFMLSKCRHIYVVMHTRILGGGACVTMTQMKTKFQVKYSYVTRVCVPKPNLLLGIVHFLHALDIKEYFTPKMDLCIDWKQILNEYVICILICTYELRNIYIHRFK